MPRFMLDTDISSYVMKRSSAPVLDRLRETAVAEVCVSVITKAELLYGVELSPRPEQDRAALEAFLLHVETLEFQDIAAVHYAAIRANLKRRGQLIGANDLLIVGVTPNCTSGTTRRSGSADTASLIGGRLPSASGRWRARP
jgi:tRNA(fMet)-specific endonuclease VapC